MTQEPAGPGPFGPAPHPPAPGLYLIAVPIGNLRDVTLRALDVLNAAEIVACEDTRVTGKLLNTYGLNKTLLRYHEHNAARMRPELLSRLAAGQLVALVSDAGMPLISDPGYKLVRAARGAGHPVLCIPGASASLTALVVSGLPSDRFLFAGFVPTKSAARRAFYMQLAAAPSTLVVFESARRLADSLADLLAVVGDRDVAVCRELTKLHEEVATGRLSDLAATYAARPPPKGEITLVVGSAAADISAFPDEALDQAIRSALVDGSLRDAVARVTAETGVRRRLVYDRALALAGESVAPPHGRAYDPETRLNAADPDDDAQG